MERTFFELFAGAGGMSMGLEMAGWRCIGHAEIEPHARAVLRHHWPDTPLHGDVAQIDGTALRGVTMITGGSPCQDLSLAGKRAGMTKDSGTRSSLFFEQIRIWHESEAPFILWENVYGAFSSQQGRDFAAVLSAIVGAAVPVPADGWRGAGVASGPAGVAAWRTLDAQYFGVPQRRRRVFVLGVRGRGVDPAEVLSLAESLSGDSTSSAEAGESFTANVRTGFAESSQSVAFNWQSGGDVRLDPNVEQANTLQSNQTQAVLAFDAYNQTDTGAVSKTLNVGSDYSHATIVLRNREGKPGGGKGPLLSAERSLTLGTANDQVLFPSVAPTVTAKWAKQSGGPAGSSSETNNLVWWNGGQIADALTTTSDRQMMPDKNRMQVVFTHQQFGGYSEGNDVAPTMQARDYKDATTLAMGQVGTPRRLTPTECERLMGWPDQHTAHGINEKGRAYDLPDTGRYKLCGNGIASPVVAWIGFQLRDALDRSKE